MSDRRTHPVPSSPPFTAGRDRITEPIAPCPDRTVAAAPGRDTSSPLAEPARRGVAPYCGGRRIKEHDDAGFDRAAPGARRGGPGRPGPDRGVDRDRGHRPPGDARRGGVVDHVDPRGESVHRGVRRADGDGRGRVAVPARVRALRRRRPGRSGLPGPGHAPRATVAGLRPACGRSRCRQFLVGAAAVPGRDHRRVEQLRRHAPGRSATPTSRWVRRSPPGSRSPSAMPT